MLLPLVGLTAGWQAGRLAGWPAGWLADEMGVDFEILKILYRLSYSDFYFVLYCYNVIIVLLCILTGFSQLKLILRCALRRKKFRLPFFSMSIPTIKY